MAGIDSDPMAKQFLNGSPYRQISVHSLEGFEDQGMVSDYQVCLISDGSFHSIFRYRQGNHDSFDYCRPRTNLQA